MQNNIQQDLKQAMLARDEITVSTLRMLLSELKYAEVRKGETLGESEVIGVIQKEIKKRREAAEGFRKGGREEQAQKEETELVVLEKYMPLQISDEELTKIVEEVINNLGATTMQDMGKVIGEVMAKVGQGAEGSRVSALIRQKLVV